MIQETRRNSLIIVAILLVCGSVIGAPRMTLPETVFDFGFTPQNSTVSHKFWLISSGEDSLLILKVVPG
jgi:hypothetical protein